MRDTHISLNFYEIEVLLSALSDAYSGSSGADARRMAKDHPLIVEKLKRAQHRIEYMENKEMNKR